MFLRCENQLSFFISTTEVFELFAALGNHIANLVAEVVLKPQRCLRPNLHNTFWWICRNFFFRLNKPRREKFQSNQALTQQFVRVILVSNLIVCRAQLNVPTYTHNAHKLVWFEFDWNELKREISFFPLGLFSKHYKFQVRQMTALERLCLIEWKNCILI